MACLRDGDVSIRRRALDLLFTMCTPDNAADIGGRRGQGLPAVLLLLLDGEALSARADAVPAQPMATPGRRPLPPRAHLQLESCCPT